MNKPAACIVISALLALGPAAMSAEPGHHVAGGAGLSLHGSETSAFVGVDYAYIFESKFAIMVFYEEVAGDFDLRAAGLSFGKFFDNGWKVGTGPGIETKLKDNKNLFLWHAGAGYDWHRGAWSFGPMAVIDFIEDESTTFYLGFSVGYGF